jgi:hypothetical protein
LEKFQLSDAFRAAQVGLTSKYLREAEDWAERAGERALKLVQTAFIGKMAGGINGALGEMARLYIDGHDAAAIVFGRRVIEMALKAAIPDSSLPNDSGYLIDEFPLSFRIDIAFKRGKLKQSTAYGAHQLRISANIELHNTGTAGETSLEMEPLEAIAICLAVMDDLSRVG